MAPQVGLEPTTDRLTADSSTTEATAEQYGGPKMGLEPSDAHAYPGVAL